MIIGRQSGLGKGLGALIPPQKTGSSLSVQPASEPDADLSQSQTEQGSGASDTGQRILEVSIHRIRRNPHQPRIHFDHHQLEDLIASIKEHGVLQPLVVTPSADGWYELIAGERRLRACTIAGRETVPVILRDASEQQKLEWAIIENVQRQDLNPVEEARAYIRLMDEFGLTQEQVGEKVGKSRPQIANTVRLLQLPEEMQKALVEGRISASHARTLLSIPTQAEREALFQAMLAERFTVRQTEARTQPVRRKSSLRDANLVALEERVRDALHSRVQIKKDARGEGEIRVKFFSPEELVAICDRIAGTQND